MKAGEHLPGLRYIEDPPADGLAGPAVAGSAFRPSRSDWGIVAPGSDAWHNGADTEAARARIGWPDLVHLGRMALASEAYDASLR